MTQYVLVLMPHAKNYPHFICSSAEWDKNSDRRWYWDCGQQRSRDYVSYSSRLSQTQVCVSAVFLIHYALITSYLNCFLKSVGSCQTALDKSGNVYVLPWQMLRVGCSVLIYVCFSCFEQFWSSDLLVQADWAQIHNLLKFGSRLCIILSWVQATYLGFKVQATYLHIK